MIRNLFDRGKSSPCPESHQPRSRRHIGEHAVKLCENCTNNQRHSTKEVDMAKSAELGETRRLGILDRIARKALGHPDSPEIPWKSEEERKRWPAFRDDVMKHMNSLYLDGEDYDRMRLIARTGHIVVIETHH